MRSLDIARLQSAPVGHAVSAAEIATARARADRLVAELEYQARLAAQHYAAIERLTTELRHARIELKQLRRDVAERGEKR